MYDVEIPDPGKIFKPEDPKELESYSERVRIALEKIREELQRLEDSKKDA